MSSFGVDDVVKTIVHSCIIMFLISTLIYSIFFIKIIVK